NLNLSEANIRGGKYKVCLEYHIGNCKGPCEGLQSEEDYNRSIDQVRKILKGSISEVMTHLKDLMKEASGKWEFELAAKYKEQLDILENYQSKSTVVSRTIHN